MKQITMNDWKEPDFGTRQTGMTVPEGFFTDFQRNLELRIDELEAQQARSSELSIGPEKKEGRKGVLHWWSVAASVALILGLFAWFNNGDKLPADTLAENSAMTAEAGTDNSDLSESMMLASLSDYDIYEALYAED